VATTAHRDQKLMRACEIDGIDDVGNATTARDQRWSPINHAVPDLAGVIVTSVAGAEKRPL
jgi:hypothetical protein